MKKDPIDRLFEEKLKDHSEVPDPKVWKAIESSLDKKKKSKRVIPIWWKYAGVAAVLLLALYLLNPAGEQDTRIDSVTDTEKDSPGLRENNMVPAADSDAGRENASPVVAVPQESGQQTQQPQKRAQDGSKKLPVAAVAF